MLSKVGEMTLTILPVMDGVVSVKSFLSLAFAPRCTRTWVQTYVPTCFWSNKLESRIGVRIAIVSSTNYGIAIYFGVVVTLGLMM